MKRCGLCGKLVYEMGAGMTMEDIFEPRCDCRYESGFELTVAQHDSACQETTAAVVTEEEVA